MFFTPSTSLCLQTNVNVNVSVNVSVAHLAALLVTTSVVWLRLGSVLSAFTTRKEGRKEVTWMVMTKISASKIIQKKLETIFLVTGKNLVETKIFFAAFQALLQAKVFWKF